MEARIVVLGAGLVGRAIAIDLKKSGNAVTAVDLNRDNLMLLEEEADLETRQADFTDRRVLRPLLKHADIVVGAAPGSLGFKVMENVIGLGRNLVDISFCPEDFMELDALARTKGVTAVADMGVAPGICNTILGYHDKRMEVHSYKCVVGGLPVRRGWPLEYKSSWSPIDCIEEYTRPARFRISGKEVVKPALSDAELVEFERIGTLEEWNSDGLRSLLKTMPHIPDMVEKTLRYPGTINYIRALRDLGYFSHEPIELNGTMISPVDLTARLLFPRWKLEKGEREFTIMRIIIEGKEEGESKTCQYELYDEYDPVTDTLSMARTTGYSCTGVVNLVLRGMIKEKGVLPPEKVGVTEENFTFLMHHLRERGVEFKVRSAVDSPENLPPAAD
ncbi:MAG: saccharopine dehydrogenase NADP-binding domain-containing protein [Bacteroidales bacterium]|nr:saccharopine dehydrogenase NADP-binding domain-containing protein [Bacteroidales bacterium]MBN2698906.1 saccharopine dehydrogenase NADP-binding domain-containing protein [Bacteroidales bacterium]